MNATIKSHLVVLTTADSAELADRIAAALIERRLAACVNIVGPVTSVYRWKGEVTRDEERLLVIKTSTTKFDRVREAIEELHTYDIPEVLALPVHGGSARYLGWIDDCLAAP